eukprot:COSAG06_NODE_112_length_23474_cov_81.804458_27_plen_63_part_00
MKKAMAQQMRKQRALEEQLAQKQDADDGQVRHTHTHTHTHTHPINLSAADSLDKTISSRLVR